MAIMRGNNWFRVAVRLQLKSQSSDIQWLRFLL